MNLKILIADDERPARNKLRSHLKDESGIETIAEAQNGLEAVEVIRNDAPDLVFLDIQMPGMTGFEVIESVGPDVMPATVFVTAYDEFALKAFEVEAVDYLLKPFDRDRFRQAFQRALNRIERRTWDRSRLFRLLEGVRPGPAYLERIVVREGGRLFFIPTKDVLRVSAQENYVELHTSSGSHLIRDTLNHLETRLDPEKFARIHRSDIVNVDCIKELQSWSHGDYIVVMKDGSRARLSRRYQDRLLHRFK